MRAPLLNAWAGGPKAARLTGSSTTDLVRAALATVESVLGSTAGLMEAQVHDWQDDPYARGAYSYMTVGGQGAREALAAPLQRTLYFAGEATNTQGEAGTVGGALQSGIQCWSLAVMCAYLPSAQRNVAEGTRPGCSVPRRGGISFNAK
jgi:monoamine oxidase